MELKTKILLVFSYLVAFSYKNKQAYSCYIIELLVLVALVRFNFLIEDGWSLFSPVVWKSFKFWCYSFYKIW